MTTQVNTDYPGYPVFSDPVFNAADFGATGSMSWTVDSGDVVTFRYGILGLLMFIWLNLQTTTVGGTVAGQQLTVKIPGGFTAKKTTGVPGLAGPGGGGLETFNVTTTAGSNLLTLVRIGADWVAGSNNTRLTFETAIEIQ